MCESDSPACTRGPGPVPPVFRPFAPLLAALGMLALSAASLDAQFDTRLRSTLSGGLGGTEPYELYHGPVRLRSLGGAADHFSFSLEYTEKLLRPLEGWLRWDLTRNENSFLAFRARLGRAETESRLRARDVPAPLRLFWYPSLPATVSWWAGDALVGHSPRNLPDEIRIYGGYAFYGERLRGGTRPDTSSAVVELRPDNLIRVLLPWRERALRARGAFIGAELRLEANDRLALTVAAEQRYRRVDTNRLDEAHQSEFRAEGRNVTTEYAGFGAMPLALSLVAELRIGTWRKIDPRRRAAAAVQAGAGRIDGAEVAADWKDELPDAIRSALLAADTAAAIELLEAELERQPRNPLILGTLGVLLVERGTEEDAASAERVRARQLLERALALDRDNPRYLVAYALLLERLLLHTDARRVLVRAFDAALARPTEMLPADLAHAFFAVGRSLELHLLETEGLRHGSAPPLSLNWSDPPAFYHRFQALPDVSFFADSARTEMVASYEQALALDPTHDGAHRGLIAAWARRGLEAGATDMRGTRWWNHVLAQARRYRDARPDDPWPEIFVAAAYYWLRDPAAAEPLFAATMPRLAPGDRRMFEDLATVLAAADGPAWAGMDEARQAEVRDVFWRERDPLYLSGVNERELEHMARVAAAELLFGEPQTGLRGWQSDRGQILIRYGLPGEVWQWTSGGQAAVGFGRIAQGGGARTIFWNYSPALPSFVFQKQLGRFSVRHATAPQNLARLEHMSGRQPELFEPPFADAGPIQHQAARFRGLAAGEHEILIFAQIPLGLLGVAPADTVVRGVVLHEGVSFARAADRTERSPVGQGLMDHRFTVAPGSYAYAVEAMTPDARRAAASRGRLEIEPVRPGLAMSDILVTAAAVQRFDSPDPASAWELDLQPLRCMGVPADGGVGFVFEIYGLTAGDGVARYRVTLDTGESPAAGTVTRLLDRLLGRLGEPVDRGLAFDREVSLGPDRDRMVDWFELTLATGRPAAETMQFGVTVTDLATGESVRATRSLAALGCR